MVIIVNCIIRWLNDDSVNLDIRDERVLWISEDYKDAYTIALNDNNALPSIKNIDEILFDIQSGAAVVHNYDVFESLAATTDNYKKKFENKTDKNYRLIEPLINDTPSIFGEIYRGRVIAEVVATQHVSKKHIYFLLRRFWQYGQTKESLIPRYFKAGAPSIIVPANTALVKEANHIRRNNLISAEKNKKKGRPRKNLVKGIGINVTVPIKVLILLGKKKYFDSSEKYPWRKAYNETLRKLFYLEKRNINGILEHVLPPKSELITLQQFKYHSQKNIEWGTSLKVRYGERAFNQSHRPLLGDTSALATGPGAIFQIDATIGDVFLVAAHNPLDIIGRPVIYIVMDQFSRMIVGINVGLTGPSWLGAISAIANCAESKVDFCKIYGIDITFDQWPCTNLPEEYLADRGELKSEKLNKFIVEHKTAASNTASFRADWKGIIERQFKLINDEIINWAPGAIYQRKPGEENRFDARLTVSDFTALLIGYVLYYNNMHVLENYPLTPEMISDGVAPIPKLLWKWGIKNRSGKLRSFPLDAVRLSLLPRGQATISRNGICYNKLTYTSPAGYEYEWAIQAHQRGRKTIEIIFDPRRRKNIYWIHPDRGLEIFTLHQKHLEFENYSDEDFENFEYFKGVIIDSEHDNEFAGQIALSDFSDTLINKAEQRYQQAIAENGLTSKHSRISAIKQNRKVEKKMLDDRNAWMFVDENEDSTTSLVHKNDTNYIQEDDDECLSITQKREFLAIAHKTMTVGKSNE